MLILDRSMSMASPVEDLEFFFLLNMMPFSTYLATMYCFFVHVLYLLPKNECHQDKLLQGSNLRNLIKKYKSMSEFWIGVSVRHHR